MTVIQFPVSRRAVAEIARDVNRLTVLPGTRSARCSRRDVCEPTNGRFRQIESAVAWLHPCLLTRQPRNRDIRICGNETFRWRRISAAVAIVTPTFPGIMFRPGFASMLEYSLQGGRKKLPGILAVEALPDFFFTAESSVNLNGSNRRELSQADVNRLAENALIPLDPR